MDTNSRAAIGVGIDTARYGHYVTFLREDLQPACPPLEVAESREGYDRLEKRLKQLHERHAGVHFHIRLDVAGQYAANLEAFLRALPISMTISVGEPGRNKSYREAHFPKRKADAVDSLCAARFAIVERPSPEEPQHQLAPLREVAGRLEAQTRQTVRLRSQLHNLLSRVFPELSLAVADLSADWTLSLLAKYPTPSKIVRAKLSSLTQIPFLTADKARRIQEMARSSVASLQGEIAEILVTQLVAALRASKITENRMAKLLVNTYHQLPDNHITSIPGIGDLTAAVLTAKVVQIERFCSPNKLVSYFGIFPEEHSSGFDKRGRAKAGCAKGMSRKGNDLVRKYLWNAAKSATLHNPVVRDLFRRLVAGGQRGDVALGHCMRKLLHLVYAVWTTGKPFDPAYRQVLPANEQPQADDKNAECESESGQATVHRQPVAAVTQSWVEFAYVRQQVTLQQVLSHLGLLDHFHGSGPQRRGCCPIHSSAEAHHRTFSINLNKNVFRCFDARCALHGNVLDLWAILHKKSLRDAALDLVNTFGLEHAKTEKRNPF